MADLTIRNLTTHPIELVSIQRFESERVQTGNVLTNVTKTLSGLINATEHSSHETVAKGNATSKDDVSVRVDPFRINKTNIRTADPGKEVIRLTFKYENHRYETDIPSPSSRSTVLKKLDNGPHELTAVYIPTGALLAIFSSAKLNSWMKELDDKYPLPVLSIPGTHNSPTCHTALPSVRCQAVSVEEQLNNGVRYLDIRLSVDTGNPQMALVHSAFPISLTGTKWFGDMLTTIYEFLDKNPSETIIMSLKREGTGKGNDGDLGKYLKQHYVDKTRHRWWNEPRIPRLGEARGRIIVLRRFRIEETLQKCWDGRGYGLDASTWPDNCEDGRAGGEHIRVQDFYEITETQNIEKKIEFTRTHLEKAAEQAPSKDGPIPPFFINFLSASNFFDARCWPERIAAKVNPSVIEYLCARHGEEGKGPHKRKVNSGQTGIVVTDWVGANGDWDLIRCIVGMNARLQRH